MIVGLARERVGCAYRHTHHTTRGNAVKSTLTCNEPAKVIVTILTGGGLLIHNT